MLDGVLHLSTSSVRFTPAQLVEGTNVDLQQPCGHGSVGDATSYRMTSESPCTFCSEKYQA